MQEQERRGGANTLLKWAGTLLCGREGETAGPLSVTTRAPSHVTCGCFFKLKLPQFVESCPGSNDSGRKCCLLVEMRDPSHTPSGSRGQC